MTNQKSKNELKAEAYDIFIQIKYHESILQQLNQKFIELSNDIQKEVKDEPKPEVKQ